MCFAPQGLVSIMHHRARAVLVHWSLLLDGGICLLLHKCWPYSAPNTQHSMVPGVRVPSNRVQVTTTPRSNTAFLGLGLLHFPTLQKPTWRLVSWSLAGSSINPEFYRTSAQYTSSSFWYWQLSIYSLKLPSLEEVWLGTSTCINIKSIYIRNLGMLILSQVEFEPALLR